MPICKLRGQSNHAHNDTYPFKNIRSEQVAATALQALHFHGTKFFKFRTHEQRRGNWRTPSESGN